MRAKLAMPSLYTHAAPFNTYAQGALNLTSQTDTGNTQITDQRVFMAGLLSITYISKEIDDAYTKYKYRKLNDGSVYILIAPTDFTPATPMEYPPNLADSLNILSAFTDLLYENPDFLLHAFPVFDSKTDTLTQSQMLKDPDRVTFQPAQQSEKRGLQ